MVLRMISINCNVGIGFMNSKVYVVFTYNFISVSTNLQEDRIHQTYFPTYFTTLKYIYDSSNLKVIYRTMILQVVYNFAV